jgi:hypothetical protein
MAAGLIAMAVVPALLPRPRRVDEAGANASSEGAAADGEQARVA